MRAVPEAPPLPRRSSSSAGGTRRSGQRLCTDPAVRTCRGATLNGPIQQPPLPSTAPRPGRPGTPPHRCSPSAPAHWYMLRVGPFAPPWAARLCRAGPETRLLASSPATPEWTHTTPGPCSQSCAPPGRHMLLSSAWSSPPRSSPRGRPRARQRTVSPSLLTRRPPPQPGAPTPARAARVRGPVTLHAAARGGILRRARASGRPSGFLPRPGRGAPHASGCT